MGFREWWGKSEYLRIGGYTGLAIGFLKLPFFFIFGENLPGQFVYYAGIIPDEVLCRLFNLGYGESCGFFFLYFGFIYNPLFYGMICALLGFFYNQLRRKG